MYFVRIHQRFFLKKLEVSGMIVILHNLFTNPAGIESEEGPCLSAVNRSWRN